jgi:hypothetical protein
MRSVCATLYMEYCPPSEASSGSATEGTSYKFYIKHFPCNYIAFTKQFIHCVQTTHQTPEPKTYYVKRKNRKYVRLDTKCHFILNYTVRHRILITFQLYFNRGPDSSVGIVTGYGLYGPGIKSRWGRDFPHLSRLTLGPTQPPVQWVPHLSRGKERPGRDADPSPLLVPWSPEGRAILLLPLWAVRPVQSLSACTRVHFTCCILTTAWF